MKKDRKAESANVILTDFPEFPDWDFIRGLEDATGSPWQMLSCPSNHLFGNPVKQALRLIKYLLFPFRLFLFRRRYDKIISWQQYYGLIFAFYCAVFHVPKRFDLTIMSFIFQETDGLMGRIHHRLLRKILCSGYVDRLIISSRREAGHYSRLLDVPESLFHFVPLGLDDSAPAEGAAQPSAGPCYVSAGRSNRDYETLLSLWPQDRKLIVITDQPVSTGNASAEMISGCYGKDFLRRLSECRAGVVFLKDEHISAGQLVILQCFMLGKPVIVTRSAGTEDYVRDQRNGLYAEKNAESLEKAIRRLDDPETYREMCRQAREDYERNYSIRAMGFNVGAIICGSAAP